MSNFSVTRDLRVDNLNVSRTNLLPKGDINQNIAFPNGKLLLHTDGQIYYSLNRIWIPVKGNGAIVCSTADNNSELPINVKYIGLGNDLGPGVPGNYTMSPWDKWIDREIFLSNANGGAHTITVDGQMIGLPGFGTSLVFPATQFSTAQIYVPGCAAPDQVFVFFSGNGAGFTIV